MAIVLVAADLRPAVVAMAPVLSEIQATEQLSATAGGSSPPCTRGRPARRHHPRPLGAVTELPDRARPAPGSEENEVCSGLAIPRSPKAGR